MLLVFFITAGYRTVSGFMLSNMYHAAIITQRYEQLESC